MGRLRLRVVGRLRLRIATSIRDHNFSSSQRDETLEEFSGLRLRVRTITFWGRGENRTTGVPTKKYQLELKYSQLIFVLKSFRLRRSPAMPGERLGHLQVPAGVRENLDGLQKVLETRLGVLLRFLEVRLRFLEVWLRLHRDRTQHQPLRGSAADSICRPPPRPDAVAYRPRDQTRILVPCRLRRKIGQEMRTNSDNTTCG